MTLNPDGSLTIAKDQHVLESADLLVLSPAKVADLLLLLEGSRESIHSTMRILDADSLPSSPFTCYAK
jgi:hypothetical protein